MKYAWKDDGTGNSVYIHLNRTAGEGETQGFTDWTVTGKHGLDDDMYHVVDGVFMPIGVDDIEEHIRQKEAEAELAQKIAAIEAERYQREIADLDYNGILIPQDRESRSLMADTFSVIRRGVATSVRWTCKNGYLDLTQENIAVIEGMGLLKIQAAFDWAEAEKAKLGV